MSDYFSKYLDLVNKEKNKYRGAGFIFYQRSAYGYTTDFDILLGVDNKKPKVDGLNELSVFGGGKEKTDPNTLYTAVRETFEELFNILPGGLDFFTEELQKKVNDGTIVEKVFVKDQNEICYFTELNTLNLFINHLNYQKSPWTFKGKHEWSEYYNNIRIFINDRELKNNQKAKNGLNEIKRIYLVKWSELIKPVEPGDILGKVIIIGKKKYKLRYNLNRYIEEKVILDILNKNL